MVPHASDCLAIARIRLERGQRSLLLMCMNAAVVLIGRCSNHSGRLSTLGPPRDMVLAGAMPCSWGTRYPQQQLQDKLAQMTKPYPKSSHLIRKYHSFQNGS